MNIDNGRYWNAQLNVVHGCVKKSAGCDHCWAEKLHMRRFTSPFDEVKMLDMKLGDPALWAKHRVCIVSNLGDLFQPRVSDDFIYAVYGVMALWPQHTFLTLTKYPARRKKLLARVKDSKFLIDHALKYRIRANLTLFPPSLPLHNVWEGTTIENAAVLPKRLAAHQSSGFTKGWLSLEPLLEDLSGIDLTGVGQVVVGGEIGKEARPCHLEHLLSIAQQCDKSGIPCLINRLGSRPVTAQPDSFDLPNLNGKARTWLGDGPECSLRVSGGGTTLTEWPRNLLPYRSLVWG